MATFSEALAAESAKIESLIAAQYTQDPNANLSHLWDYYLQLNAASGGGGAAATGLGEADVTEAIEAAGSISGILSALNALVQIDQLRLPGETVGYAAVDIEVAAGENGILLTGSTGLRYVRLIDIELTEPCLCTITAGNIEISKRLNDSNIVEEFGPQMLTLAGGNAIQARITEIQAASVRITGRLEVRL